MLAVAYSQERTHDLSLITLLCICIWHWESQPTPLDNLLVPCLPFLKILNVITSFIYLTCFCLFPSFFSVFWFVFIIFCWKSTFLPTHFDRGQNSIPWLRPQSIFHTPISTTNDRNFITRLRPRSTFYALTSIAVDILYNNFDCDWLSIPRNQLWSTFHMLTSTVVHVSYLDLDNRRHFKHQIQPRSTFHMTKSTAADISYQSQLTR